jgi:hypothetical protein
LSATTVDAILLAGASPIAEPRLRLNVVCPYYTMFPLSFPLRALADAGSDGSVLDPFCGRGTTAYAARLLGLRTVGIDADAVAVAIASSKLVSRTSIQVEARLNDLLDAVATPDNVPEGDFWSLAFERATLLEICRVREALRTASTDDDILLRAILLGILHGPQSVRAPNYLSNQMPRTYATKPRPAVVYWKKTGLQPRRVDVRAAVGRRARYLLKQVPETTAGRIMQGDSRRLADYALNDRFSHVVTSPPYLGMRSYRPDQWLRHWFLGGPEDVDYGMTDMLLPSADTFATQLAGVWAGVAKVCEPGATLTVRFGALPSVNADAESTLRASLADTGWEIEAVASAGSSSLGKRQAKHMNRTSDPTDEIDLCARLTT